MAQIDQPTPYEWARELLAHRSAPRGIKCKKCGKEWPCADYSVAHEVLRSRS